MAISSINIQPSSGNAIIHNERIFDVAYALKNDDVNEYHRIASISETRKAIYEDYKLHHGRKLNTKATPIREAVVNLNENHKMEDLINLSQMLENDYQMKVLHIAIHRDEGHIDKDGKENKVGCFYNREVGMPTSEKVHQSGQYNNVRQCFWCKAYIKKAFD